MKTLVCIPFLADTNISKRCIDSVVNSGVDVFLFNNGGDESMRQLVESYMDMPNVYTDHAPKNIYVNPAWNMFMQFFLNEYYDRLIIMNNDIVMQPDWYKVLEERWKKNIHEICLPKVIEGLPVTSMEVDTNWQEGQTATEGTAGIFITLTRKQAELVYPIPNYIKVWFGDNWIFEILRNKGYKTVIIPNLLCNHQHSTSVRAAKVYDIIEEDKKQWALHGESDMKDKC